MQKSITDPIYGSVSNMKVKKEQPSRSAKIGSATTAIDISLGTWKGISPDSRFMEG